MAILFYSYNEPIEPEPPVIPWTETFTGEDGSGPNSNYWTETDPENNMSIQNNKLNCNGSDANNSMRALGNYEISGDFDIQVDWDLTSFSNPGSVHAIQLAVGDIPIFTEYASISFLITSGGYIYYATDDIVDGTVTYETTDTDGKFRLTRSGSTIKAYVWSGGQWEWDGDINGRTIGDSFSTDVKYNLRFKQDTNSLIANFDNFKILQGTLI